MSAQIDVFEDVSNPLDSVEEILSANEWSFDRMSEDELTVQISGKMGEYKMLFVWQEDYSAMQFCCEFDLELRPEAVESGARAMTAINAGLWLGHFDIRPGTSTPCFRHTSLFRGMTHGSGADHLEDLVDIALAECERYYPAFTLLSRSSTAQNHHDLALAMMETAGES